MNLWISALKCRYELTQVVEIYSVDGTLNNLFGRPDLLKSKWHNDATKRPGHCYIRTLLQLWNTVITLFSNCYVNNTDCRDLTNDNGAESFLTS